jgi:DNA-binding Lrp family transcriptional regulator
MLIFEVVREISISAELVEVFERLNVSAHSRQKRIERLHGDRLLDRFFAYASAKLREIGERLRVRHLVNLTGCPMW